MRRSRFEWRGKRRGHPRGVRPRPGSIAAPLSAVGANGGAARRPRRNGGQLV